MSFHTSWIHVLVPFELHLLKFYHPASVVEMRPFKLFQLAIEVYTCTWKLKSNRVDFWAPSELTWNYPSNVTFIGDYFKLLSSPFHNSHTSLKSTVGKNPDSGKVKPKPVAPNKCDPELSFDAVTELRGETIVFKGRCVASYLVQLKC